MDLNIRLKPQPRALSSWDGIEEMYCISIIPGDSVLVSQIEFVKQYLHIESYRFNGKLSWDFQQDPTVDVELIVPKMLIHIFVENAIKHGITDHCY